MTTTLITGANKGIGRETARRLVERATPSTPALAAWSAARLPPRDRRFVQLDVTDDTSVAAAMDAIQARDGRLDVLVNNAGITDNTVGVEGVSGATALTVLDTNVAGVVPSPRPLFRSCVHRRRRSSSTS